MGEKKINFWKIIKGIKRQSIRMQQRLIVYWCVVILTLFLVTVLLLSILGVLPGMDFKVREMLSAQQKNTLSTMTEQTDIMMARSISLSEDITKELNQCLTANGKTFSNLNDNPQLIMDLEAALYPSLKSALDVKYCSGVFVVLDATVNTKTEYADTSRMGIYLRLSDLKAVNTSKQHVVFFRGNADIARAEQVQLHNRWNLEFDTSALSGYEQIMQFDGNRLVESCLWTDRLELSDTWEDVQLLYVPVLDSTGKVRGLCGMEMSNLYFRLSYPMVEGSCGNIVTVLAPVDKKGNIYLDKAMFGDTKETYLSPSGTMTVKKGKYYNTYSTAFGNYIGRHELLGLKSCNGMPLAVLTLISEANYEKLTADNRRDWIIGTLLFLILLLVVSVGMSHRFVKPILRSLKALQEDTLTDENLSGISEVDALVDFMQKKRNTEKLENGGIPPNIEEIVLKLEDEGNKDAPWPWEGEPVEPVLAEQMVGSYTIVPEYIPFKEAQGVMQIMDHQFVKQGNQVFHLLENKLDTYEYSESGLEFVSSMELDDDFEYLSGDSSGMLYLSPGIGDVIGVKDGKKALQTTVDGDLNMHPSGEWGISFWVNSDTQKIANQGGNLTAEPWILTGLNKDEERKGLFSMIDDVQITNSHIMVAGSMAVEDEGTKIVVYDYDGK